MGYAERLSSQPASSVELITGSLPSIDDLRPFILAEIASAETNGKSRPENIIDIITKAKLLTYPRANKMAFPERDILSLIYLDAAVFSAQTNIMVQTKKKWGFSNREVTQAKIMAQLEARKVLLNDLSNFVGIHNQVNGEHAYDALEVLFYDAQCLVVDAEDLENEDIVSSILGNMRGVIGEVKIVEALREEGWPAYYSKVKSDLKCRIDAVVKNTGDTQLAKVPISVKSNGGEEDFAIEIEIDYSTISGAKLEVTVPVVRGPNFIKMPLADRETLSNAVLEFAALAAFYREAA